MTTEYANEFGVTEPNLDHLGLTFREMAISLPELEEYVRYVNFGAPPAPVCKYPILKEDQLNFLKPGSKEVVTRPVHIHEHLPPMNSILEGAVAEKDSALIDAEKTDEIVPDDQQVFKKPSDLPPGDFKKLKRDEEGSRPTREISSVMMTTSGFLSPAREGKLPEAKTPLPPPTEPPPPPSAPPVVNPVSLEKPLEIIPARKPPKPVKKVEKKKDKIGKELFKGNFEDKVKKSHSKDHAKMKQLKALANASALLSNLPQGLDIMKLPPIQKNHKINPAKFNNKALQAARMKTEKLNTTITPLPMKPQPSSSFPNGGNTQGNHVDKLLTVPDKKKINILKKISNVKEKEEKALTKKEDLKEDPGSPPDLIIDEPEDTIPKIAHLPSDITIEPINPPMYDEDNIKIEPVYMDDSPPGTPSTPKTPELMPTPVVVKEKKKRKYKVRKTKPEIQPIPYGSFSESESVSDRPRTPKAEVDMPQQSHELPPPQTPEFPFGNINPYHLAAGRPNLHFLANFGGPGLIPPPLGNPLNPLSNPLFPNNFPLLNLPDFGQNPYLPSNLPPLPNPLANLLPKVEDEMPSTSTSASETASLPPPKTPEAVATTSVKTEKPEKKSKEHKKEKKDKLKKKAKKEKLRAKAEKKEEKKKIKKKEKREKRKEKEASKGTEEAGGVPKLTLKIKSPSPRPITPDTPKKLLNIKPVVKKEPEVFDEPDSETSSLAKISALVTGPPKQKNAVPSTSSSEDSNKREEIPETSAKPLAGPGRPRIHPVKAKPVRPKKKQSPIKKDAEGNEVWICPGCGRQDDGSPMIGCDGCDAWYHWVCVGIQVPPDANVDWYCRHCLLKKDEDLQTDKKKKRKRKDKKEHV